MTPSLTEIVCALGGCDRLVGVDQYSEFPPSVAKLDKMGTFLSPNAEAIAAKTPDLVLLDGVQKESAHSLSSVGIHALALPVLTLDDVYSANLRVGKELALESEALRLNETLKQQFVAAATQSSARRGAAPKPRALLVIDRELGGLSNMVVAGRGTYLHELVLQVGGDNAVDADTTGYIRMAPEAVIELAPDIILDAVHTSNAAKATGDWNMLSSVPAVKNQRVVVLADRSVVTPGPRMGLVAQRIADILYPVDSSPKKNSE